MGFDYIALGHIHKPYHQPPIAYPGSTISLGFDELGSHGMLVGNIDDTKKLELTFIPMDPKEFKEEEIVVDDILSKEELIETIHQKDWNENYYYKIILTGKRNFEIEPLQIIKYITQQNIIKIKDNTTLKQDLEKLVNENSLRGIFVKNLLAKQTEENKEKIQKAIEIGLEAM
ncbi:MAG: hypothetical protein HFJ26_03170 [Clostridia bacterium]|nr:hypothetical protein [Clostridia bacterium]